MVRPLLSPTITDLDIYCDVEGDNDEWICSLRVLFHVVSSVATHLTSFELRVPRVNIRLPLTILSPFQNLEYLRTLEWCFPIDSEALRPLLCDKNSIEIGGSLGDRGQSNAARLSQGIRNRVGHRSHSFTLSRIDDVNLRDFFSSQYLRELTIARQPWTSVRENSILATALARCFPCLQVLEWSFLGLPMTSHPVPQEGSYVEQSIRPLMKLRNLLSLTVHATNVPQVTEAELVSMADAWPLLTTLRILETPAVGPGDAEPGPAALVALASRCPNLEVLQLRSCYIPKSVFSRLTEYPVLDHPLKTVFFSTFRTDDYQYAALLFDRLFPHLDFEPQTPTDGPANTLPGYSPHPSWVQLCAGVRALQMARRYHENALASLRGSLTEMLPLDEVHLGPCLMTRRPRTRVRESVAIQIQKQASIPHAIQSLTLERLLTRST